MAKMKELQMMLDGLKQAVADIHSLVTELEATLSTPSDEEPNAESPPEVTVTLEEVRAVLAEKSRTGHTAEVRALLQKYGASKLSDIDPERYPALMKEAEVVGDAT